MSRHESVVPALVGLGEARKPAELPQRAEQLPPPGQRLMYIALVPHVQHQTIPGSVKHAVDRHGQLHHAQIGCQMSAGAGHLLHQKLPQLLAQQCGLLPGQPFHVCGAVDLL